ncbi:hypothetical protein scyTo_0010181, partial [Scyliorhinus torazame]|nr:hypothetical protein [Scyliorhinus torazame]
MYFQSVSVHNVKTAFLPTAAEVPLHTAAHTTPTSEASY